MKRKERKRRIKILRPYLAQLQALLNLGHWDITLTKEEPPEDRRGRVFCTNDRHLAVIYLGDQALSGKPEELRETIIHELLHCHGWAQLLSFDDLSDQISTPAWETWLLGHRRVMEFYTDALAHAIAPRFPEPPSFE